MIDTPEVVRTEAESAAIIHLVIPKAEIREHMGPGIQEVMAAVVAQGVGPAGPWFTRHHRMVPDVWDFEVGVPVSAPVTPVGRVVQGELPAATVARTIYHGAYEGLAGGWGELEAWITATDHRTAGEFWERYLVGPESTQDAAGWRTELNRPLAGTS
jgi:effector-binding domain-containing protein